MDRNDLPHLLHGAIQRLITEEWDLAVVDAHETTITSHLSRMMICEGRLEDWIRVDNDYNRHLLDTKRAHLTEESDDDEDPIRPDILVHRRGSSSDNVLVVEAKKRQRHQPNDETKIRALLQDPFNYTAGVLLDFGIKSREGNSSWEPAWCWMVDPNEDIVYEEVFGDDESVRINNEGKRRWHLRR